MRSRKLKRCSKFELFDNDNTVGPQYLASAISNLEHISKTYTNNESATQYFVDKGTWMVMCNKKLKPLHDDISNKKTRVSDYKHVINEKIRHQSASCINEHARKFIQLSRENYASFVITYAFRNMLIFKYKNSEKAWFDVFHTITVLVCIWSFVASIVASIVFF